MASISPTGIKISKGKLACKGEKRHLLDLRTHRKTALHVFEKPIRLCYFYIIYDGGREREAEDADRRQETGEAPSSNDTSHVAFCRVSYFLSPSFTCSDKAPESARTMCFPQDAKKASENSRDLPSVFILGSATGFANKCDVLKLYQCCIQTIRHPEPQVSYDITIHHGSSPSIGDKSRSIAREHHFRCSAIPLHQTALLRYPHTRHQIFPQTVCHTEGFLR